MYMVDFEILEDIPHYGQKDESLERRYTCPAMGLFYVRGNGDIVPIAIQFHQVPSETNPIWTPNDTEMDWIYAKMWLRNADTQWHQVSISLLDHCLLGDLVTSLRRTGEKILLPYPMKQRAHIRKFCFCLPCRSNKVRVPFIGEFWVLSNPIPRVEL